MGRRDRVGFPGSIVARPGLSRTCEGPAGLSAREIEILRLVADGLTNIEVAERLFLSSRTVDRHLSSVYRKLGLHSCPEAARFASDHGRL